MKRVISKTPTWCYVALFFLVIVSLNIHITSYVTNRVVSEKMEHVNEMVITDVESFYELQKYYTNRYDAQASVVYLLQPKDYIKLYKENVSVYSTSDSLFLTVPTKVVLSDERKFQLTLKKNDFVRLDKNTDFENNIIIKSNTDFNTAYVFPIYHYRTHISEFVLFFENDVTLTKNDITRITSELQALSNLIK